MGRERRPTLLKHPGEGILFKRRSISSSLGPLKCNWSSLVKSHEDQMRDLEEGMRSVNNIAVLFFVLPIIITFLVIGLKWSFSIWGLIAGLPISILLTGLFLGFAFIENRRRKRGDGRVTVFAPWRKVTRDQALGSVKEFMDQYSEEQGMKRIKVVRGKNQNYPTWIYKINDKVHLKAFYSGSINRPIGWLGISYSLDEFEKALELQISVDDFMDQREILKKRGSG